MAIDVTAILAQKLARNRGYDLLNPDSSCSADYGVAAFIDGSILTVKLTFRAGVAYCCTEPGCHLPLFDDKRWDGLRRELTKNAIAVPPRLELQLSGIIEEGALTFDFSKPDPVRRGRYAFKPEVAGQYQITEQEAPP